MAFVTRARYKHIDTVVDRLITHHKVFEPPVPIEKLARSQGIQVSRADLGDISGLLLREDKRTLIGVNSEHPKVRQRFTIAHEFGHFVLHEGIRSHLDKNYRIDLRSDISSEGSSVGEIEANYFAASILMPRKFLDASNATQAIDDDEQVAQLARLYNVSRHAMSLRLANVYRDIRPY